MFGPMPDRLPIDRQRLQAFASTYVPQRTVVDLGVPQLVPAPGRPTSSRRRCRFCLGEGGEVRDGRRVGFRTDAHLVPQQVGNEALLTDSECDACNNYASRYERELGEYTLPIRAILGVVGKRGTPAYEAGVGEYEDGTRAVVEVGHVGGRVRIIAPDGFDVVGVDEQARTFTLSTPRRAYRPLGVYKSLAKAAYALLDEDELVDFGMIRRLLTTAELDDAVSPGQLALHGYSLPGGQPAVRVTAQLWRRRDDVRVGEGLGPPPSKVLTVLWANQFWQIPVPATSDYRAALEAGGRVPASMPLHPAPVGGAFVAEMGAYGEFSEDLSSNDRVDRAPFSSTFRFDSIVPVPAVPD